LKKTRESKKRVILGTRGIHLILPMKRKRMRRKETGKRVGPGSRESRKRLRGRGALRNYR